MTDKIVTTPYFEALHAFDAHHQCEPHRTIAERLVMRFRHPDDLTDDIAAALEDAYELGQKRGLLIAALSHREQDR